jgi:hypothetical protein
MKSPIINDAHISRAMSKIVGFRLYINLEPPNKASKLTKLSLSHFCSLNSSSGRCELPKSQGFC